MYIFILEFFKSALLFGKCCPFQNTTASWSSLGRHLSTLDQRFQKLLCQVASLNALMVHVNITFKSRLIYLPEDLHRLVLNILNTCKKLQSLLLVEYSG